MPRREQNFRQSDLTKALKAATRAGLKVVRAKIDHKSGSIDIVFSEDALPDIPPDLDRRPGSGVAA
jgi:hypothetical protein